MTLSFVPKYPIFPYISALIFSSSVSNRIVTKIKPPSIFFLNPKNYRHSKNKTEKEKKNIGSVDSVSSFWRSVLRYNDPILL